MPSPRMILYFVLSGVLLLSLSCQRAHSVSVHPGPDSAARDSAHPGTTSSGGGDAYSLEFTFLGRQIAKALQEKKLSLPGVEAYAFNHAVENTSILTIAVARIVDERTHQLKEVDAINYPALHKIEISRPRWQGYGDDLQAKVALVIHEYLGVMGLKDSQYQISGEYLSEVQLLSARALKALLLEEIDSACGDTWCEGDFSFTFTAIECHSTPDNCWLSFTMSDESGLEEKKVGQSFGGESAEARLEAKRSGRVDEYDVSCTFPQYHRLGDLAYVFTNGRQGRSLSLNRNFYRDLTACIHSLENSLPSQGSEGDGGPP